MTVTVTLRDKASLFPKALDAFHHNGHSIPHPFPQTHPPAVRNDADEPHREAARWGDVWVSHSHAGDNPNVAWPHESGFSCHSKQVLGLFVGAVDQQHLSVYLLQQSPCSYVVHAVGGHIEGQNILEIPHEVAGVSEGLDVIHIRFITWIEAGYDHKTVPVVLFHHLKHAVDLLLDGGSQLEEVGALTLQEKEHQHHH